MKVPHGKVATYERNTSWLAQTNLHVAHKTAITQINQQFTNPIGCLWIIKAKRDG